MGKISDVMELYKVFWEKWQFRDHVRDYCNVFGVMPYTLAPQTINYVTHIKTEMKAEKPSLCS